MKTHSRFARFRAWFDARDFQIAFLALFLWGGVYTRDWTLRWDAVATAIATCLVTQALWMWARSRKAESKVNEAYLQIPLWRSLVSASRSAAITSLSLCLLLRANSIFTIAIAAALAISSKFSIRVGGKHVFNPANFGIIAVVALTSDAWVSPGQWGTDAWLMLAFAGA
ncbi:MAG: Na+-transporting NADH:ubiquinone oxidoreductase, subunit NqrB, partial [Cyanobacteria bacterium J06648_11]